MKGAIASVEIYAADDMRVDRLSLVIGAPERAPSGDGWQCRVALADRIRPETVSGRDSVEVLGVALDRARRWLEELVREGRVLTRDRAGTIPYELP
jgi:hypothetical protein